MHNAISKINSTLVLGTLAKREQEWKQDPQEFQWIKKHALRTLLKQWHPKAFAEFGYHDPSHLTVANLKYSKKITIWEIFKISFDLIADDGAVWKCKVDYAIWYLKSNWKHTDKVYRLTKVDTQESLASFSKTQVIKLMTTRALYSWEHFVKVIVNGKIVVAWSFILQT
jgi:hypothetical protein